MGEDESLEWDTPCLEDGEDEESRLGWLLSTGFSLGKKLVITGVLISSFPLVLPPLVVISALGFAFSVPFGVVFASYAGSQKLMSKLLPSPHLTPALPPINDDEEDEVDNVVEKEEKEEREDTEDAIQTRIELLDGDDTRNLQADTEQHGYPDVGECSEEKHVDSLFVNNETDNEGEWNENFLEPCTGTICENALRTEDDAVPVSITELQNAGDRMSWEGHQNMSCSALEDVEFSTDQTDNLEAVEGDGDQQNTVAVENQEEQHLLEDRNGVMEKILNLIEATEKDKQYLEELEGDSRQERSSGTELMEETESSFDSNLVGSGEDLYSEEAVEQETSREKSDNVSQAACKTDSLEDEGEQQNIVTIENQLLEDKNEEMDKTLNLIEGAEKDNKHQVPLSEEINGKRKELEGDSRQERSSGKETETKLLEETEPSSDVGSGVKVYSEEVTQETGRNISDRVSEEEEQAAEVELECSGKDEIPEGTKSSFDSNSGEKLYSEEVVVQETSKEKSVSLSTAELECTALGDKYLDHKQVQGKSNHNISPNDVVGNMNRASEKESTPVVGLEEVYMKSTLEKEGKPVGLDDVYMGQNASVGGGVDIKIEEHTTTINPGEYYNESRIDGEYSVEVAVLADEEIPKSEVADDACNVHSDLHSDEGHEFSDESIWQKIDAIRVIVGLKSGRRASYFEEVEALYLFTGIQPPSSPTTNQPSESDHLTDLNNKLRILMSVIGLK